MVMVHVHVESTVKNVKFSHPNEYSDIIKAKKKAATAVFTKVELINLFTVKNPLKILGHLPQLMRQHTR